MMDCPGPYILVALVALLAPATAARQAGGSDRLALEGATVHSMVPGEAPHPATVLIADGRVVAVGAGLELPPGTARVDLTGKHLVPALLDGYVGFDPAHDLLYSSAGIGLVRDLGGDRPRLLLERQAQRRVRALGPMLITGGALLDGDPPATSASVVLRGPNAAEALLPILFEERVDFLSIYVGLTPATWQRVIDLAHANRLEVWGPVPTDVSLADALKAGQDGIHFLDRLVPEGATWQIVQPAAFDGAIELLQESGTVIVPLLNASARRFREQGAVPEYARLLELLDPSYEVWWRGELARRNASMTPEILAEGERVLQKQIALVARLHASGVRLLPGSGAPQPWLFPGQGLHQELALWVRAGIEPAEVLRLATRGAAEILGVAADHGSIQPGARAALIVSATDPSTSLAGLVTPVGVVVHGRYLDQAALEDLLASVETAQARVRDARNRPIEVDLPPAPEGVTVLTGLVETRSYGQRLSTERFSVVRLAQEQGIAFLGRVVHEASSSTPEREVLVSQITLDGELAQVEVRVNQGDETLSFQGLWTAGTWRMRRTLNGEPVGVTSTPIHPVAVDTGSVTSLLVLGQAALAESIPMLVLHQGLAPETATWSSELDDQGNHQIRTHVGRLAFRFDPVGAPERALTMTGQSGIETVLIESEAFGGPGLPLPARKRERIAALQASAAAPPVEAPTSAVEDGGGDG